MTEREKMLSSELYLPADPELTEMRRRARQLLRRYNNSEENPDARRTLLAELFGALGNGVAIEPPFYCEYGANIEIGENGFMNFGCVILDCARVTIGDRVLLGPYVQLLTATHPIDPATRATGLELARPIAIADDVWLGGGAIILPGISIGAGSVIGAGAVVTADVPPGVVAAGNPCRALREIKTGGS